MGFKASPGLLFWILCPVLMLSACSNINFAPVTTPKAPVYKPGYYFVRPGDTLFSIAWAYGLDYRTLEKINGIGPGQQIQPGQYLRITTVPGFRMAAAPAPERPVLPIKVKTYHTQESIRIASAKLAPITGWIWPVQGPIIMGYNPAQGNKGINIAGSLGTPIKAAASGIVVYAGNGLSAYGNLIILKNSNNYLSAYAYNQTMLVKEGQAVRQGQIIATMGRSASHQTLVHFEIRKNGQPVNPMLYLKD